MRFLGRTSRRRAGFTLMEIMIAVTLFSLFTLTITAVLRGGLMSFKRGQVLSALRGDVSNAMSHISTSLRSAAQGANSISMPALTSSDQSKTLSLTRLKPYCTGSNDKTSTNSLNSNIVNVASNYSYAISYKIDKSGDVYNLYCTDANVSNSSFILLDNVMCAAVPGAEGSGVSYFQWKRKRGDTDVAPSYVMNIRLMSGKYCGEDLLTCTMVTESAVRSPGYSSSAWLPIKASGKTRSLAPEIPAINRMFRPGLAPMP